MIIISIIFKLMHYYHQNALDKTEALLIESN